MFLTFFICFCTYAGYFSFGGIILVSSIDLFLFNLMVLPHVRELTFNFISRVIKWMWGSLHMIGKITPKFFLRWVQQAPSPTIFYGSISFFDEFIIVPFFLPWHCNVRLSRNHTVEGWTSFQVSSVLIQMRYQPRRSWSWYQCRNHDQNAGVHARSLSRDRFHGRWFQTRQKNNTTASDQW